MTIPTDFIVFIGVAVAAIVGEYLYRRLSGPPFLVRRWAKDYTFRILHCEYRHFSQGPFTGKTHRGVTVYYVRVEDFEGRKRSGWVRCYSGWGTDKAEVIWEENAA